MKRNRGLGKYQTDVSRLGEVCWKAYEGAVLAETYVTAK